MNLTSSANVNLTGITFLTAIDTLDAKLRTTVLNVNSSATGAGDIVGYLSASTSTTSLNYGSATSVRGSTVTVRGNGTGKIRGIYVPGANRFSIRDTNVFVSGAGADIVGVETILPPTLGGTPTGPTGPNYGGSFAELKTSTVYGLASTGPTGACFDIRRTGGGIQLSATDLVNATANDKGFTVNTEPSHVYFILGSELRFTGGGSVDPTPVGTYYLSPGTTPANFSHLVTGVPFGQRIILFEAVVSASIVLPAGCVATVSLFKSSSVNTLGTQFGTDGVINSTTPRAIMRDFSRTFETTEYIQIRCVISGASTTAGTNISVGIGLY
jgi:hypothetical protein